MSSPQLQMMHRAERKYRVVKVADEEEAKQRQLRAILNKLTPQNFEKLFEQVKRVNIDNAITLTGLLLQIFDRAHMEPIFCGMYAKLCYHLAAELPDLSVDNEKITFKRLLLNKCQEEFEREEVKQSEEEDRAQTRMIGNIRLIGELYKNRMLTERIMHECIKKLLGGPGEVPDEEDVEALCILMSTIGEMIDHPKAKKHMDAYFDMMAKLSTCVKLSSRVRFMLLDAIDLRNNMWQQRSWKAEGPKKLSNCTEMPGVQFNSSFRGAFQKGLMSSSPLQMMHRAERKYQVCKVADEEEAKQRQLRAILNKLTPQNFEKLLEQVKQVNIDNAVTLVGVALQIFDRALMEPIFCEIYARLCCHLAVELPDLSVDDEKITLKRLLLNKCQEEFERREVEQSKEELGEGKRDRARRRMLGNIRLIGELHKKKMLTERIIHECIKKLLGSPAQIPDEEDVEALCKLITTVGEIIDHPRAKEHMDAYFDVMAKLSNCVKLSSRVRFRLLDAIDLRKNMWQQRSWKAQGPEKLSNCTEMLGVQHKWKMSTSSSRSRTRSQSYKDPTLNLRYMNMKCRCYNKAEIIVVTDEKRPTKGRLFYNCNRCNFFKWCEPIKASWKGIEIPVSMRLEDIEDSDDENNGETVTFPLKKKKKKNIKKSNDIGELNTLLLASCCILLLLLLVVLIFK